MKKSEKELRQLLTEAVMVGDYEEADLIHGEIDALRKRDRIIEDCHHYVIYEERGLYRTKVKLPDGRFKQRGVAKALYLCGVFA